MKILFLNVWNGKLREPLTAFLKERLADTDVFCLQEANDAPFFDGLFKGYGKIRTEKYVPPFHDFAQVTYVKKSIGIRSSTVLFENQMDLGAAVIVGVPFKAGTLLICNFHGLATPVDKLDSPQRLRQSCGLIKSFQDVAGPVVIGGDFNLMPGTESIQAFEKRGYRDLIKDFDITTTRNRISWEKYPGSIQYYSDYVFVNGDARVKTFSVPQNEISDHLPMIVEIG